MDLMGSSQPKSPIPWAPANFGLAFRSQADPFGSIHGTLAKEEALSSSFLDFGGPAETPGTLWVDLFRSGRVKRG